MRKNKKAQVTLYVYFIIAALILVIIAAVLAPMGVQFNSVLYEAGEEIMLDSLPYIEDIDDADVRTQITSTINSALASQQNNIEVNAAIFQYGWVAILILSAIIVFLHTRRLIAVGGAGGFI